ncbi:alpha/beta fold hydrolase [Fibrobacterota bacterium]
MFLLKTLVFFLVLQQLAYRANLRGLLVRFTILRQPWVIPACLAMALIIYLAPESKQDWPVISLVSFLVMLAASSLWPAPGYLSRPVKRVCSNKIEYYLFAADRTPPAGNRVFLHGAGNDALFDNYELFNLWHKKGQQVIAINLPGHGKEGSSELDPDTAEDELLKAWQEISAEQGIQQSSVLFTGESLGAAFALRLALRVQDVQQAHLLCPPCDVNPGQAGIAWEVLHFFAFQLWWRLGTNTLWNAIPSFSWFKRKFYPIRYKPKTGSRMQAFVRTVEALETRNTSGSDIVNHCLQVTIYHGRFDGVIPLAQSRRQKERLDSRRISCHLNQVPGTHLSIKKWYAKMVRKRNCT